MRRLTNRPKKTWFPASSTPLLLVALAACCLPTAAALAATSAAAVTSSSQLLTGAAAAGRIGDMVLANGEIVVVISAVGHLTQYSENGGTVIDAGTTAVRVDALGELYTYFDNTWPRQAVYTSLSIVNNGAGGGPAVIRATGHDLNNAAIAVLTDYALGDGDRFLTLTTRVTGSGASLPNFELGDAFQWGSCDNYAPGYGFSVSGTTTQAWMAGLSPDVCYAYGGVDGNCWGPSGNGWSDLNLKTATLSPTLPVSYTRFLAVSRGEIAAAVAILYEAMGTPTGSLTCDVRDRATSAPLTGAVVAVYDGSGSPLMQAAVDGTGQAYLGLPAGDWRVQAGLAGYAAQDSWLSVTEGGDYWLSYLLVPDGSSGGEAVGDTLTVIQRPLVNIPALVLPGDSLPINCVADPATTGWQASLSLGALSVPLPITQAAYNASTGWWTLAATVPASPPLYELYDLRVTASGGLDDTTRNAVRILQEWRDDYTFVHITDVHLPDHAFSDGGGTPADSTETVDLRAVIGDINLINPEFVVITGDLINEGELEDYLEWRAYTRSQRMLYEFEVPTFLVAGNHDIGGWSATPPADGTARRDWWRFFGWKRLDNPPPGAPWRTQNFSFNYGPVHYVGMEAYNNYDNWRSVYYGTDSFIAEQLTWLSQDLAAASASQSQVLFYHKDFQNQLNLGGLGVEMALWGHIHSDSGSLAAAPYNLATAAVCDGARAYRVIRVSNGVVQPLATLRAGAAGENLRVAYTPSNAGLSGTVTAVVTNAQPQRFENGRLRFVMPAAGGAYAAAGGTLVQVDQSGTYDVCFVAVDIPAAGSVTVTVSPDVSGVADGGVPGRASLAQNHPNPFNPVTVLEYSLPAAGPVTVAVYDLQGREIAVLVDEEQLAGGHAVNWDGKDSGGREAPSGVYLVRLRTAAGDVARKVTLAR